MLHGATGTPASGHAVAPLPARDRTFRGCGAMDPLRTDTGAPVRHANTSSDVGDHVAFGVDPPCDRQFSLSCRLLSAPVLGRRERV